MPTIFVKNGYRFFFYSNDHEPIHAHVQYGSGEAVFEVAEKVRLRESVGMTVKELSRAQTLAEENRLMIIEAWHGYFG